MLQYFFFNTMLYLGLLLFLGCTSGSCTQPTESFELTACQRSSFPYSGFDTLKFSNDGKIYLFIGQGIRNVLDESIASCGCECPSPLAIETLKITFIGDTFNIFMNIASNGPSEIDKGAGIEFTSSFIYRTTGIYNFKFNGCQDEKFFEQTKVDSLVINDYTYYDVYQNYNAKVCYNLSEGLLRFQVGYGNTAHLFERVE